MVGDRWPDECVRSWRGVLEERRPDRDELQYETDAQDHLLEAEETRRLHMLRGMLMAQTAEVEDLLATLCEGVLGIDGARKASAGGLLGKLRDASQNDALPEEFGHVDWLLRRRNELVHATLEVGYVNGLAGERMSVLTVLRPIRGGDVPWKSAPRLDQGKQALLEARVGSWAGAPTADTDAPPEVYSGPCDIDEVDLKMDLRRAHIALESAVTIFQHFSHPRSSDGTAPANGYFA